MPLSAIAAVGAMIASESAIASLKRSSRRSPCLPPASVVIAAESYRVGGESVVATDQVCGVSAVPASLCAADTQAMTDTPTLTAAQALFADAHGSSGSVRPARPRNGSVYIYREREGCTDRWLVARNGTELEWTLLRYAAA